MSLTPRLLVFAALIALLAAFGVWQSEDQHLILRRAWMVPAGLLILALILDYWLTRRYRIMLKRELPHQVQLASKFDYRLTIEAKPARPLRLVLAEYLPEALGLLREAEIGDSGKRYELSRADWQERLALDQNGLGRLSFPAQALSLQGVQFFPFKARVLGVLGLAWWARELGQRENLLVVPQLLTREPTPPFLAPISSVVVPTRGQSFELHSLRDYQASDPQRSIDWKASARSYGLNQSLKVRVMHQEQDLHLVLALDIGRRSQLGFGSMRRFEHMVNIAARLGQFALQKSDTVHLLVYDRTIVRNVIKLTGKAGLQSLQHALRALRPSQLESDPMSVHHWIARHLKQGALVAMLADTDGAIPSARLLACVQGLRKNHQAIVAGMLEPTATRLANEPQPALTEAERYLSAHLALGAEDYLQHQRRHFQSLRDRGARVVIALPEALDSAMLGAYRDIKRGAR